MTAQPTVFARSKEIERLTADCLSVEELVGDLGSLVLSVENYCLSPLEETLCTQRFEAAVKRARIDPSLLEYSSEGFRTTSDRILKALKVLVEKLIAELSVFWAESFGHAKRLRRRVSEITTQVQDLKQPRPKKLIVTGEFGITRVLAPTNGVLKAPTEIARELLGANRSVLSKYASELGRWLLRASSTDQHPPVPKYLEQNPLPGSPSFYARDPDAIVWGLRFNNQKIALDATKSQLEVATRNDLLKICGFLYDSLEAIVNYEREWRETERALKQLIRELEATGSEGYETARARKLAYAAAALPRQWARYGLYLSAQLTRYISVCVTQY